MISWSYDLRRSRWIAICSRWRAAFSSRTTRHRFLGLRFCLLRGCLSSQQAFPFLLSLPWSLVTTSLVSFKAFCVSFSLAAMSAVEMPKPMMANIIAAAIVAATPRWRRVHRETCCVSVGRLAVIGRSSRNRCRSSASSSAVAYRSVGFLAIAFMTIVSSSTGIA